MPVSAKPCATPKQALRRRASFDRLLGLLHDRDLLKALAEPTRARLLSCLLKCARPCSVTEVAACCELDFSTVARHLQTMANAGLVTADKQGRTVWYSADGAALSGTLRALADAVDELRPVEVHADGDCCAGDCAPTKRAAGGRR